MSELSDILKSPNALEELETFRVNHFRYEDLFELFDDLKGLFRLGYTALWSDSPPDYGITAWKGEGEEESSLWLRIPIGRVRASIQRLDNSEYQTFVASFQTSEGKRLLLETLQAEAQRPEPDAVCEKEIDPLTCWERIMANE